MFREKSPVCVDLFIEGSYFVQGSEGYLTQTHYGRNIIDTINWPDTALSDVIKHYWSCFGIDKEECDIGNMRVHNIDFRRNTRLQFSFVDIPFVENKDAYLGLLTGLLYWNVDLIVKSFNEITVNSDHLPINSYVIENLTNYQRISKQYENIPNAELLKQTIIQEFINGPYSFSLINGSEPSYLIAIGGWFMDIYGIARIVKSIYSYQDSRISMIYAGGNHIRNYINFLQKVYNAKIIYQTQPTYDVYNFYKNHGATDADIRNEYDKLIDISTSTKSCINIDGFNHIANDYLRPIFMNKSSCSMKVPRH